MRWDEKTADEVCYSTIGDFWLIQQAFLILAFVFLGHKIFWWGCLYPLVCCARGQLPPPLCCPSPIYVNAMLLAPPVDVTATCVRPDDHLSGLIRSFNLVIETKLQMDQCHEAYLSIMEEPGAEGEGRPWCSQWAANGRERGRAQSSKRAGRVGHYYYRSNIMMMMMMVWEWEVD